MKTNFLSFPENWFELTYMSSTILCYYPPTLLFGFGPTVITFKFLTFNLILIGTFSDYVQIICAYCVTEISVAQ